MVKSGPFKKIDSGSGIDLGYLSNPLEFGQVWRPWGGSLDKIRDAFSEANADNKIILVSLKQFHNL